MSKTWIVDFLGCVFGAILFVILINSATEMLFFSDRDPAQAPMAQKAAEGLAATAEIEPEQETTPEPASVAAIVGAADAGAKVFKKCKSCHSFEVGAKHKIGPNLFGVVGRVAGTAEGYKFSQDMKNSGLTWDEETLGKFLLSPKGLIKKTKMSFAGLKKESQRADLIAYLKSLE